MWPNPQETADLVTFTGKTLNGKLYFLCSDTWYACDLIHEKYTLRTKQVGFQWNISDFNKSVKTNGLTALSDSLFRWERDTPLWWDVPHQIIISANNLRVKEFLTLYKKLIKVRKKADFFSLFFPSRCFHHCLCHFLATIRSSVSLHI